MPGDDSKPLTCCNNEAPCSESGLDARLQICLVDANSHDRPDNAAQEAEEHGHPHDEARSYAAPDTDKVQSVQLFGSRVRNYTPFDQVADPGVAFQVVMVIQQVHITIPLGTAQVHH